MPPDLSAVSVVVLSHNRREDFAPNLRRMVEAARETGLELIVVDNASTDGSRAMIEEALCGVPGARAILNEDNLGVAGGRNSGWRVAGRDFILNIDDDTEIEPAAIAALLSVMLEDGAIGAVSPRIVHPDTGARQFDFGDAPRQTGNFHGCCHMVRGDLVRAIGLNDEACSFGGEELDYSIRARAAGFRVVYTPRATARHKTKARTGAEARGRRTRWLYNFVRIFFKHFPPALALALSARCLTSHLVSGLRAHGPGFVPALAGAAFAGARDGRRQHEAVPADVVAFYRDPDVRPEFGNVPIWRKLSGRLRGAAMRPAAMRGAP